MKTFRILTAMALMGVVNHCFGAIRTTTVVPTRLYSFTGGVDGGQPESWLTAGNDGAFYGTTFLGGGNHTGTVFKITSVGTLTTLYSFTGGADGAAPMAGLAQGSDGNFYGMTPRGGASDTGTVFQITPAGTLTTLYSFSGGADGGFPLGGLVQGSDSNFYGTTSQGGANRTGTVFQITSAGSLTTLYSFTGGADGAIPEAGLIQAIDGNFYGTTALGGTNNDGTVFQISSNGVLATIYQFDRTDGRRPAAPLVQGSDGSFYGTTRTGGIRDDGTVFQVTSAGTFTSLHHFVGVDGSDPRAALIQAINGFFYGTTLVGGNNDGAIFQIASNGVFRVLYGFAGGTDGGIPYAALVQGSDKYFYGTTGFGGPGLHGTVFRFTAFPGGTYTGLAIQTNAPSATSSGFLNLNLRPEGSFQATLTMGSARSAFQGQFDASGNVTNTVSRKSSNPLQVIMQLSETGGTNQIVGTVSDGVFTSQLLADLTAVFTRTNPCPETGSFTFTVAPANTNDTSVPQGFGYGTLTVNKFGRISLRGVLGDGTRISTMGTISGIGSFPLYEALYKQKQGSCAGWLTFPTTNTARATVNWFKPSSASDKLYPGGFTTAAELSGAAYVSPSHGGPSIAENGQLILGGGNLPSNIVKSVTISDSGSVTVSPPDVDQLTLAILPTTGLLSGSFHNTAVNKTINFSGFLLQSDQSAAGLFFGTSETGFVVIEPNP